MKAWRIKKVSSLFSNSILKVWDKQREMRCKMCQKLYFCGGYSTPIHSHTQLSWTPHWVSQYYETFPQSAIPFYWTNRQIRKRQWYFLIIHHKKWKWPFFKYISFCAIIRCGLSWWVLGSISVYESVSPLDSWTYANAEPRWFVKLPMLLYTQYLRFSNPSILLIQPVKQVLSHASFRPKQPMKPLSKLFPPHPCQIYSNQIKQDS